MQGSGSSIISISTTDLTRTAPNTFITTLISIRYRNIAKEPVDIPRVIEFVVSDGLRTNNPPARTVVNVLAFNDPPQVDLNGIMVGTNAEANYTEADSPTFILPQIEIYDQDSSVISEAYARINAVFDVGSETVLL